MVHMLQTTQHLKAQNTDDSIFSSTKNVAVTGLACQSFFPWRHSCTMCIVIGTSTSVEFLYSASFFWPILTSLGSHCHTSKTGCLKASTVPCERWYYTSPTNTSNRSRREETRGEKRGERQNSGMLGSYLVGLPQPDVEGGFSEGIYGLLGEHVLQATELPVNPR